MTAALRRLVIGLGLLAGGVRAPAEPLQAGAAKIEITPPVGFPMWGYASRHDSPSLGVHDPLWARALVLTAGKDRIALVSLDLGRPPTRQTTAAVRGRVQAAAGIAHVFLAASHTHHGPVLELDTWPTPENSYVRQLEQKITGVILEAARASQPARLGVASREVPLNRTRHAHRTAAPVDRALSVVRVEDVTGKPIALAVNFAAHPTLSDRGSRFFSADYPGVLADRVEKETGALCLFLQGAAGDLSPNPPHGERGAEPFGRALADEVLALAKAIHPTVSEKPSLKAVEEDFRFGVRYDLGSPAVKALFVAAFFRDLVHFYEREYREGVRPHLTVALLDGRIGMVGVSGEFYCGHALSLKRRARLEHVLFLGYCNDYHQYFPTIEAAAEGGYGTAPPVAPAELGAGERMMDRALIHLFQLRGQLPAGPRKP